MCDLNLDVKIEIEPKDDDLSLYSHQYSEYELRIKNIQTILLHSNGNEKENACIIEYYYNLFLNRAMSLNININNYNKLDDLLLKIYFVINCICSNNDYRLFELGHGFMRNINGVFGTMNNRDFIEFWKIIAKDNNFNYLQYRENMIKKSKAKFY
jgi:hypothetical protein